MKLNLVILRGISGSGKTTLAHKLDINRDFAICSTDSYFYIDGEYKFDHTKLGHYHQLNWKSVYDCLRQGQSVIVDNINTTYAEMKPYIDLARYGNIPVYFMSTQWVDWEECWARNVHGVPKEVVKAQNDRFESDTEVLLKYLKGL